MSELINDNHSSSTTTTTTSLNTNTISGADQECVSFLMTLKHRAITPPAPTTTRQQLYSHHRSSHQYSSKENDNPSYNRMQVQQQPSSFYTGRSMPSHVIRYPPPQPPRSSYILTPRNANVDNRIQHHDGVNFNSRETLVKSSVNEVTPTDVDKSQGTSSSNSSSNSSSSNRPSKKSNDSPVAYDCFASVKEYQNFRSNRPPPPPPKRKSIATNQQPKKLLPEPTTPSPTSQENITDEKLTELMGDTKLVQMGDRDLVPDYLFLAMAQMKLCHLTEPDRVGCYKERKLGFIGMACKHCGGQPGFGKYFPATVRSLAQTTTSQTIVKHVAVKCRLCPPEIRLALVKLQSEQAEKDKAVKEANGSVFDSRPRYGSRKIFFQRLWSRLHGGDKCTKATASEPTSTTKSRKQRRAVVSPNFEDSITNSSKFSNRWPSIARHMMKSDSKSSNNNSVDETKDHHVYNTE